MPRVVLGNPFPIFNGMPIADPNAMTMAYIPDNKTLDEMVKDVAHFDGSANAGLWYSHSASPRPTWVVCDENPELELAIANHFGCPTGRPGKVD